MALGANDDTGDSKKNHGPHSGHVTDDELPADILAEVENLEGILMSTNPEIPGKGEDAGSRRLGENGEVDSGVEERTQDSTDSERESTKDTPTGSEKPGNNRPQTTTEDSDDSEESSSDEDDEDGEITGGAGDSSEVMSVVESTRGGKHEELFESDRTDGADGTRAEPAGGAEKTGGTGEPGNVEGPNDGTRERARSTPGKKAARPSPPPRAPDSRGAAETGRRSGARGNRKGPLWDTSSSSSGIRDSSSDRTGTTRDGEAHGTNRRRTELVTVDVVIGNGGDRQPITAVHFEGDWSVKVGRTRHALRDHVVGGLNQYRGDEYLDVCLTGDLVKGRSGEAALVTANLEGDAKIADVWKQEIPISRYNYVRTLLKKVGWACRGYKCGARYTEWIGSALLNQEKRNLKQNLQAAIRDAQMDLTTALEFIQALAPETISGGSARRTRGYIMRQEDYRPLADSPVIGWFRASVRDILPAITDGFPGQAVSALRAISESTPRDGFFGRMYAEAVLLTGRGRTAREREFGVPMGAAAAPAEDYDRPWAPDRHRGNGTAARNAKSPAAGAPAKKARFSGAERRRRRSPSPQRRTPPRPAGPVGIRDVIENTPPPRTNTILTREYARSVEETGGRMLRKEEKKAKKSGKKQPCRLLPEAGIFTGRRSRGRGHVDFISELLGNINQKRRSEPRRWTNDRCRQVLSQNLREEAGEWWTNGPGRRYRECDWNILENALMNKFARGDLQALNSIFQTPKPAAWGYIDWTGAGARYYHIPGAAEDSPDRPAECPVMASRPMITLRPYLRPHADDNDVVFIMDSGCSWSTVPSPMAEMLKDEGAVLGYARSSDGERELMMTRMVIPDVGEMLLRIAVEEDRAPTMGQVDLAAYGVTFQPTPRTSSGHIAIKHFDAQFPAEMQGPKRQQDFQ